ncbi:MAG: response regulator transcription factor [Bacteroidota bacterium]
MWKIVLRFGMLAVALWVLLQLSQYSLFFRLDRSEVLIGVFALAFLGLGYYVSQLMAQRKSPIQELQVQAETAESDMTLPSPEIKLAELGISKRENEVLQLLAEGLSNQEIASRLYISESTVKTHVSNLLSKLGARRRTEAVRLAREKGLV